MKRFILAIPFPISLLLMCVVLFGVLGFLESVSDRREEKTNRFSQLYSIEPESLLVALESGKTDAFSPIDEEPPFPPSDQQVPVPWTQEDYLQITDALFQHIWSDTLVDWQLDQMLFGLGCVNPDLGFQNGILSFVKNAEMNGQKFRIERTVNIDPRNKSVYIAEDEYSPRLHDWLSIDSIHNQYSANEILQMAENAGGEMKRLSVENACDISIVLAPRSARYKGWSIRYSWNKDGTTIFHANIDSSTGEVNIP